MPLVAATVLIYSAGLLAGFGRSAWLMAGAGLLLLAYGARRRRERLALLAIGVCGFAAGSSRASDKERCDRAIQHESVWRARMLSDAAPGGFAHARHACGLFVRIAVSEGRADAGTGVAASGRVVRGRGGLLMSDATIVVVQPPNMLARWRANIGRQIDLRFGTDAPLVRALLIADMRQLSPTLRERYAAAGLSHMLSVSGLHVGLIAVAVTLLAQIIGLSRGRADAFVVTLTAVYVAMIGAPLPAVRAAVMLGATALSVAAQRPTSPWAVLAVAALVPLLDPDSITDLGFQLSMVGMVALVASGAVNDRVEFLRQSGWRGALYRSLVTSTMATLFTTPLVAATFGKASFVAPLSNLAAVPVMAVLQPMLFLAMALLPIGAAAQFVADACVPLVAIVDAIASLAARLPGASIEVVTDPASLALASGATIAFAVAAVGRFPARPAIAGMLCLALAAWRPVVPARSGMTELHMIDVGQGDAVALRTTRGNWILFDAGRDWQGGDAGKRDVVPYIRAHGGRLTAFVLSHPHSDHVGGAESVIRALKPRYYYDPGFPGTSGSYRRSLLAARELGVQWRRVRPLDSLVVDEAVIVFLAPDSVWASTLDDPNDASTVARVRVGDVSFLLTGDAEIPEESWLVDRYGLRLDSDVLKVAHHGSSTSSTGAFVDAVTPRVALISVGTGNMYKHPSIPVLRNLSASGALNLRTDYLGTVVVATDGKSIVLRAGGEEWRP